MSDPLNRLEHMFEAKNARSELGERTAALTATAGDALTEVAHVDATGLDDAGLRAGVLALERARRSLDAAEGRLLVELHERRATEQHAALATTRWLAREARVPAKAAKDRLSTALTLDRFLPAVADAFTEARIGFDHATVFAQVVNVRNAAALAVLSSTPGGGS